MLIEFSVENFRSIKERQTFSMLSAGKVNEHPQNVIDWDGKIKLTKSAIVYGRNASGKSNLLRALQTLRLIVTTSSNFKLGENISIYDPFKLDDVSGRNPTKFEIDFISRNNLRYQYEVSYTEKEILFESLFYYPKKQRTKLFIRNGGNPLDFGVSLKGDKKNIENQLLSNQLFLSKGANSKNQQLSDPYLFFLMIFSQDVLIDHYQIDVVTNLIMIDKKRTFQTNLNNLVKFADTSISSVRLTELTDETLKWYKSLSYDIQRQLFFGTKFKVNTIHKAYSQNNENQEVVFELYEESAGTIKLLMVGGMIVAALEYGLLVIIDELDKSLHPMLTRVLVNLFHNPKTNPKNAQLIFATHDVSLLDNELFRRDQIWFTEKEQDGATKLYSLSDFKGVRKETPYDKWYLSGRFGAIPSINESELQLEL
ncbi:MAG: ATP-binding protein [Ignavibacteriae bacterium]|nr:ATP-binding protein [Ignavibacteriota bacterium]